MAQRPNILIMVSDQHSPHVLGCAGDAVIRTPHLDALAQRGIMFDNAYCAAPLCVPSRMTFLTSRHCSDINVWTNAGTLASDIPTFAHALGAGGYETVLAGRMHYYGPDQHHGFHQRLVGDVSPTIWGGSGAPLRPIPPGSTGQVRRAVEIAGPGRTAYQAFDDAVMEAARDYLLEKAQEDSDQPFCLVAGFVLPHCPFIAPKELYDYYYDRVEMPEIPEGYLENLHPVMKQWRERRGIEDLTEEEIRAARAGYYGIVEYFDSRVGGVLEALNEAGLADDTIVIYFSDHGECAGENGLWWKSNFYEASAGVPMIISAPQRFPQGVVREEVVSLLDLAPTLTEIGEAPPMPRISGRSMLPLLTGENAQNWPDEAICEFIQHRKEPPGRMIRQGPWKLIHYHGYEPMLFNLEHDPHEFHDRAGDPQCRDVRQHLHDRIRLNWDPYKGVSFLERLFDDREILQQWFQASELTDEYEEYHWDAPPGCNVFPETS